MSTVQYSAAGTSLQYAGDNCNLRAKSIVS